MAPPIPTPTDSLDTHRAVAEKAKLRLQAATHTAKAMVVERSMQAWAGSGGAGGFGDFEAARRSRTRPNSNALRRGGSADSHRDRWTIHELRKQCQSLLRNDPLARSLKRRLCTMVVGDRITYQCRSKDKVFAKAAEKFIARWMEACEHSGQILPGGERGGRGMVDLANCGIAAALSDGDCGLITTSAGLLQFVEAERIITPTDKGSDPLYINGVQYDSSGAVVAFHVSEWDRTAQAGRTTKPIPAGSFLHLPSPADDVPNLTRPEPGLTALVKSFDHIRNYITYTGIAAQMATMFGLVIKTEFPQDTAANLPGAADITKAAGDGSEYTQKQADLEPGFILNLAPGEEANPINPTHPIQTFSDYLYTSLSMMGAEAGIPLVLWLLDFRAVNFASARSAVLLASATVRTWRRWLSHRLLRPSVRWRLARALAAGEIPGYGVANLPEDWDQAEFRFPPMPVVDPESQYKATAAGVQNRLITQESGWAEYNDMDFEDGLDQIELEQAEFRRRGIMPIYLPGSGIPEPGTASDVREETPAPGGGGQSGGGKPPPGKSQ